MKRFILLLITILLFSVATVVAQITYVLRAKKGQIMTLRLTSAKKNAVFAIYSPGMEPIENSDDTNWSDMLTKTGDYEIIVFPKDEVTDTRFTLKISIK